MSGRPCQFCRRLTATRNADGPICGVCLLAFQRGRVIGIKTCIEKAKRHGAPENVIDELMALF